MITDKPSGANIVQHGSANTIEHLIKSLVPVLLYDTKRIVFGTQHRNVQVLSDRVMVAVGGGYVLIQEHWRKVAVNEIIKMNKLLAAQQKDAGKKKKPSSATAAIVQVLKNMSYDPRDSQRAVNEFTQLAKATETQPGFDKLYNDSQFLLKKLQKIQRKENKARNSKAKKSTTKSKVSTVSYSGEELADPFVVAADVNDESVFVVNGSVSQISRKSSQLNTRTSTLSA